MRRCWWGARASRACRLLAVGNRAMDRCPEPHAEIHAFAALDSYIYGFALQEGSLTFGTPEETSELAKAFLLQFPRRSTRASPN
jgi:hypothetical protein